MTTDQRQVSIQGKQALVSAFYEYFLVTLPVGVYVSLEAFEKQNTDFLWNSPEWAIATIFLLFQGVSLYRQDLKKTGRRISDASFGIFALLSLILTIIASINVYGALHENTKFSVFFRLGLFIIASTGFLLLVSSAKLAHLRTECERNGT